MLCQEGDAALAQCSVTVGAASVLVAAVLPFLQLLEPCFRTSESFLGRTVQLVRPDPAAAAVLQSQSKALTEKGVIAYFAEGVSSSLIATGMPPVGMWMLLLIVYVAMHYLFASQSAHVAAMYPAFLAGEAAACCMHA